MQPVVVAVVVVVMVVVAAETQDLEQEGVASVRLVALVVAMKRSVKVMH